MADSVVSTYFSTLLGVPSFPRFGEFLRLVGRYCSYLLPKQAGGTPQMFIFKTLWMTGRPTVYDHESDWDVQYAHPKRIECMNE